MIDWKQVVPDNGWGSGMWMGTIDGVERYGVSVNLNTMKYVLLRLNKPDVTLATKTQFETVELAKEFAEVDWGISGPALLKTK